MSEDLSCDLWVPRTVLWDSLSKNDLLSNFLSVCSSVALIPCLLQLGFLSRHHSLTVNVTACIGLHFSLFFFFRGFSCFFFLWCLFHPYLYHSPQFSSKSLPLCFFTFRWCDQCRPLLFNINCFSSMYKCSTSKLLFSSWPAQPAGVSKCSSVGSVLNMMVT